MTQASPDAPNAEAPSRPDLPEAPLADGGRPLTPEALFQRLDARGIAYETLEHRPVFTVEEASALVPLLPGLHSKNLFLRNKKGRMWLVSCLDERAVDLKWLGEHLGGRLSFGSPERLARHLGVLPGSVTPFAILNDRTSEVEFHMDRALIEAEQVNFHPLVNTMTVTLRAADLVGFLSSEGRAPRPLDFPSGSPGQ